MTEKEFYSIIYRRIASLTPIPADCGRLCNKKCCEGDRDGDGMYLFPGEEKLCGDVSSWARISETDFTYGGGSFAKLISCDGVCDREERPLACRIFPLTPYIDKDGRLEVIVDPRARGMCPMSALHISDFDRRFVKAVEAAGKILMLNKECRRFLAAFSRMIDDIRFLEGGL